MNFHHCMCGKCHLCDPNGLVDVPTYETVTHTTLPAHALRPWPPIEHPLQYHGDCWPLELGG